METTLSPEGTQLAPPLLARAPAPASRGALRIAQVSEYYYPHLGGTCEHIHFLAREARRLGHHVDVITGRIPGSAPDPHVIQVGRSQPIRSNGSFARITVGRGLRREVREVLRRGEYDVVHIHMPLTPVLPTLAAQEAEVPLVGTFHTYFEGSPWYRLARRYFQRDLDRFAATVAVSRSAMLAHARYFDAEWTILPNGIDPELFHPLAPPPPGWSTDVPTILFLGRLDPRNGLDTLLGAFRRLRGRARRARLVVVGDGPLRGHYERLAGNDPDVRFVGAVHRERPSYYAHSQIYACPTTKASFGITLLEAMACATPVVCSDIGGFRDVVAHEREALLFPCGDVSAMADALARLLDDEPLRARLGARARAGALRYAWPAVARTVLDVYARALGRPVAA